MRKLRLANFEESGSRTVDNPLAVLDVRRDLLRRAEEIGMPSPEAQRLATAVGELSRSAFAGGHQPRVSWGVVDMSWRRGIRVLVESQDRGASTIGELASVRFASVRDGGQDDSVFSVDEMELSELPGGWECLELMHWLEDSPDSDD